MSWVSDDTAEPLAEPRNSFQETMRALADAAMSVTQHDSNEAETGYINAVREMERKFARILKGKMKPMRPATPSQRLDAATVERWVPQIGQRVRVTDASEFAGDWARTDLWVSGISVHGSGDGLDVTVAEEWPVYPRGRHHNGQTDGWRVGAMSCRDQLEPLATEPHQHGGKGA